MEVEAELAWKLMGFNEVKGVHVEVQGCSLGLRSGG